TCTSAPTGRNVCRTIGPNWWRSESHRPDPSAPMTPQEMQQLAELLQTVPGIKTVDLKDVRRLAQLLRESPEIGSIELKGWFGTGVVITRTPPAPVVPPVAPPVG